MKFNDFRELLNKSGIWKIPDKRLHRGVEGSKFGTERERKREKRNKEREGKSYYTAKGAKARERPIWSKNQKLVNCNFKW